MQSALIIRNSEETMRTSSESVDSLPVLSTHSLFPYYGPEYFATFDNEKNALLNSINKFLSRTEQQNVLYPEGCRNIFNFDFSEDSCTWNCSRSSLLDAVDFTVEIFFDRKLRRIVIKIHRLNGKSSLFSEVLKQFAAFGSKIWYSYDPFVRSEKKADKKRALPNNDDYCKLQKKSIKGSEFISTCKSLSTWTTTDPVEALDSLRVSLPRLSVLLEEATINDLDGENAEEINAMKNHYMSLINTIASIVVCAGELQSTRPHSPFQSTKEMISNPVLNASQILETGRRDLTLRHPNYTTREQGAVLQCLPSQCVSRVMFHALGSLLLTFQPMEDTATEHQKWVCSALNERSDFMSLVSSIASSYVSRYTRRNSLAANNSEDIAVYAHVLDRTLTSTHQLIACH